MKKVLALMGSQRKNKNSDKALDLLLNSINKDEYKIEKLNLADLKISPCTGCGYCGRKANCIIKDDMHIIYDHFDDADLVLVAAPLYFNSINGLTKNMIDRCQRYWSLKYELDKKYKETGSRRGIFIAVAGAPFSMEHFVGLPPILKHFFNSINVKHIGNYFISNTDRNPVESREEIKKELAEIGKNFPKVKKFQIHR